MENCMEVVIDRDAFVKGLQMVQNIVEPRQTLPILANVLLEADGERSEEHTSELQSRLHLVCRLLLEKKKKKTSTMTDEYTMEKRVMVNHKNRGIATSQCMLKHN